MLPEASDREPPKPRKRAFGYVGWTAFAVVLILAICFWILGYLLFFYGPYL